MDEQQSSQEKDYFVLYLIIATLILIGIIAAVKLNENEKFAPIKQQLAEESQQINLRIIKEYED